MALDDTCQHQRASLVSQKELSSRIESPENSSSMHELPRPPTGEISKRKMLMVPVDHERCLLAAGRRLVSTWKHIKPTPRVLNPKKKWSIPETLALEDANNGNDQGLLIISETFSAGALTSNLTAHLRKNPVRLITAAALLHWDSIEVEKRPRLVIPKQVIESEKVRVGEQGVIN
jgi:hypothetical protein